MSKTQLRRFFALPTVCATGLLLALTVGCGASTTATSELPVELFSFDPDPLPDDPPAINAIPRGSILFQIRFADESVNAGGYDLFDHAFDIIAVTPDGTDGVNVTDDLYMNAFPAWTRDGQRIGFV